MNKVFPVVLFLYKRPESSLKLLNQIIDSGTNKVYIFADGPQNVGDKLITDIVSRIVEDFISSHSKVKFIKSISSKNKGLRKSIVDGLNIVFSKESAAIVLEDDCIPHADFFRFASEMLVKYGDNPKVMSVTGTSVGRINDYSYDFSRYESCWGWATWRRAWRLYDSDLSSLDTIQWPNFFTKWYWKTMLYLVKVGQVNSWAFIWSYSHFIHEALAIIPNVNMITNIGFDSAATNTRAKSNLSNLKSSNLQFPLKHPEVVKDNLKLSKLYEKKYYLNLVAILGLTRQYFYWRWNQYAHRH